MASLYIQEYETCPNQGEVQAGQEPALASQKITFTTSAQSAAFNAKTQFIRVWADAAVWLAFAASPTATVASMPVSASTAEYFGVQAGEKVAAYDGAS